jgi:FMN hydrolase / 5-amino-6-(5-phospho-D-ribitylamino)uracil phosphatase
VTTGGLPIRAVTFDVDDTLFDFRGRMAESGEQVLREIRRCYPAAPGPATPERFQFLWKAAAAERTESVIDWEGVRRRGIELLLLECGCAGEGLVERLTELYFRHRHLPAAPFDDAAAALRELAGQVPLGVITNANTRLATLGLEAHFSTVLTPSAAGCSKPDCRIFHQAAAALGCVPGELLHVGDNWEDDVLGALGAGCQAAWLRRGAIQRIAEAMATLPGGEERPYLLAGDHRQIAARILHSRP